jgi:FixJ family two-component response regulator
MHASHMEDEMSLNYSATVRSASKSAGPATVFVVDADPSAREAFESLFRSAGLQVSTACSAEEFLARPRTMSPGCLIANVNLPGLSGLELQRRVAARSELPLIFVSDRIDIRATVEVMKGGAFEFLTKPFARDLLLKAIEEAIEHSRAALHYLVRARALQERYESLSRREREVMSLVVAGRLNKQVGGELGISEITVKAHRGKLMRKMQADSFAELVNMAASLRHDPLAQSPWFDVPPELAHATNRLRHALAATRLMGR